MTDKDAPANDAATLQEIAKAEEAAGVVDQQAAAEIETETPHRP